MKTLDDIIIPYVEEFNSNQIPIYINESTSLIIFLDNSLLSDPRENWKMYHARSTNDNRSYLAKLYKMEYCKPNRHEINHYLEMLLITKSQNLLQIPKLFYYGKNNDHIIFIFENFIQKNLLKILEEDQINFKYGKIIKFAQELLFLIEKYHSRNLILSDLSALSIYINNEIASEDFNLMIEITPFAIFEGSYFKIANSNSSLFHYYKTRFPHIRIPQQMTKEYDFFCFGLILYQIVFKDISFDLEKAFKISECKEESFLLELIKCCLMVGDNVKNFIEMIKNKFPNIFLDKMSYFRLLNVKLEDKIKSNGEIYSNSVIKSKGFYIYSGLRINKENSENLFTDEKIDIIVIDTNQYENQLLQHWLMREDEFHYKYSYKKYCTEYIERFYNQGYIFILRQSIKNSISLEDFIKEKMQESNQGRYIKSYFTSTEGYLLIQLLIDCFYDFSLDNKEVFYPNTQNIFIVRKKQKIFKIIFVDYELSFRLKHSIVKYNGTYDKENIEILKMYSELVTELDHDKKWIFVFSQILYNIVTGAPFLSVEDNIRKLRSKNYNFDLNGITNELKSSYEDLLKFCLKLNDTEVSFRNISKKFSQKINLIKSTNLNNYQSLSTNWEHFKTRMQKSLQRKLVCKKYNIWNDPEKLFTLDNKNQGYILEAQALNMNYALNLSKGKNENIIQIESSFKDQANFFLYLKLFEGMSLKDFCDPELNPKSEYLLSRDPTNVVKNLKFLGRGIGNALKFLENNYFIHRSVSPSHILVKSKNGILNEIKLCGFSSCKQLNVKNITLSGDIFAPNFTESIFGAEESYDCPEKLDYNLYSFSFDLWGLCMTLIYYLVGNNESFKTFINQNLIGFLEVKYKELVSLTKICDHPNMNAQFMEVIFKCLRKSKRPRLINIPNHINIHKEETNEEAQKRISIDEFLALPFFKK